MARISWVDSVDGDLIHLSGVTLQLMTQRSREVLVNRLQLLRAEGSRVSLDTNDLPSGWPSPQVAAEAITGRSGCPARCTGCTHLEIHNLCDLDDEVAGWLREAADGAGCNTRSRGQRDLRYQSCIVPSSRRLTGRYFGS